MPYLNQAERTRQEILDAAFDFLWSHPFRDLTVRHLMSVTGVSRSAFYRYFGDLHELMETFLIDMEQEINAVTSWLSEEDKEGDPVALLRETIGGVVNVFYKRGPMLRAISEAAPMDERLELAWTTRTDEFVDRVTKRIEQQQAVGLVESFQARHVASALVQMDIAVMVRRFGRRPRGNKEAVYETLTRVWISTLYGRETL